MPIKNKDLSIIILLDYLLCRRKERITKPNFHNEQLRAVMTPAPTPRAWEFISWQGSNGLGIYKPPPPRQPKKTHWHGARLTFSLVKREGECNFPSWGCLVLGAHQPTVTDSEIMRVLTIYSFFKYTDTWFIKPLTSCYCTTAFIYKVILFSLGNVRGNSFSRTVTLDWKHFLSCGQNLQDLFSRLIWHWTHQAEPEWVKYDNTRTKQGPSRTVLLGQMLKNLTVQPQTHLTPSGLSGTPTAGQARPVITPTCPRGFMGTNPCSQFLNSCGKPSQKSRGC